MREEILETESDVVPLDVGEAVMVEVVDVEEEEEGEEEVGDVDADVDVEVDVGDVEVGKVEVGEEEGQQVFSLIQRSTNTQRLRNS